MCERVTAASRTAGELGGRSSSLEEFGEAQGSDTPITVIVSVFDETSRWRRRVRRQARAGVTLALVILTAAVAGAWIAPAAGSRAQAHHHLSKAGRADSPMHRSQRASRRRPSPLVFGIYPGGAVGTVGAVGRSIPEDARLRQAALERLRGGDRPFVLHLYDAYTRPSDATAVPPWLASQIATYTAAEFQVEVVLRYRPAAGARDVDGFTDFVRARVRQLGANARVTGLQVTNEANVAGAPDAADGSYPGVTDALVRGVIAAKDEARHGGFRQLGIGFNWAYQRGPAEAAFFSSLGATGGRAFADAVDWVGVDAYPGTWGPKLRRGELKASVRAATMAAMKTLRKRLLPRAGLSSAALHFSESGYPTGPGRTEAMQRTAMRATVQAIADARVRYGVTDYRWFDLRDADSAATSFESQYGITRDDYSPKAAFFTFRELIARLG